MAFSVLDVIVNLVESVFMVLLVGGALVLVAGITSAITWGRLAKLSDFATLPGMKSLKTSLGIIAILQFVSLVVVWFANIFFTPIPYLPFLMIFSMGIFNIVSGAYLIKANLLIKQSVDYAKSTSDATTAYNASLTGAVAGVVGGLVQIFYAIYKAHEYHAQGGAAADIKTRAEIIGTIAGGAEVAEGIKVSDLTQGVANIAGGGSPTGPAVAPSQGIDSLKTIVQNPTVQSYLNPSAGANNPQVNYQLAIPQKPAAAPPAPAPTITLNINEPVKPVPVGPMGPMPRPMGPPPPMPPGLYPPTSISPGPYFNPSGAYPRI